MKSRILQSVYESAKDLHEIGLLDVKTMREFDTLCLPPVKKLTSREIKKIRLREKVSQPVFAKYLNMSTSTIKKWETGEKHPRGAALKLLNVVGNKGLDVIA